MKENRKIPTGNDTIEDDAREEGRIDKDEDLKTGHDKESPLAKPFEKKKITPPSLLIPDVNHGHSLHAMAEHEQPDPTLTDSPDSRINR
jgi:hypothetical protein